MGETAPFWRFSAAPYPDLERMSADEVVVKANHSANGSSSIASQVHIRIWCSLWKETYMSYLLRRSLFCYVGPCMHIHNS